MMRLPSHLVLVSVFSFFFSQPSWANKCIGLFPTDLYAISEAVFQARQGEILGAFKQAEAQASQRLRSGISPFNTSGRAFKIVEMPADKAEKEFEDLKSSPTLIPSRTNDKRVLHLRGDAQADLNFLAKLISGGELNSFLGKIGAFKVRIHIDIPIYDVEPMFFDIFPATERTRKEGNLKSSPTIGMKFGGLVATISESQSIRSTLNQIFRWKYSQVLALIHLSKKFQLSELQHESMDEAAEELLLGLGYDFTPAARKEGYWVKTRNPEKIDVWKKVASALTVLNQNDLVYVDDRTEPENPGESSPNLKHGIMTRTEYNNTWGQISGLDLYGTKSLPKTLDGVKMQSFFVDAVKAVEDLGYRYDEATRKYIRD